MLKALLTKLVDGAIYGIEPIALLLGATASLHSAEQCETIQHGYQCQTEMSHHWSMYSPWFSVPSEISPAIPDQCNVTFVQVLSRHGSRFPTQDKSDAYGATIRKIHENTTHYSDQYSFIKGYNYTLSVNDLTAFGAQELTFSGLSFFERYKQIFTDVTPFVRASGDKRVIESALNWTKGFHLAKVADHILDTGYPYPYVVLKEAPGSLNPLDPDLCYAFKHEPYSKTGEDAKAKWRDIFVPQIMHYVNGNLTGAHLNKTDVLNLMDLCPFETVSTADGTISAFCNLFTTKEWQQYDYYGSLDKYYGYGAGNYLGPTQGVGWVNELIARLTNTSVVDHTSVNHTLDSDPTKFPRGLSLYADFSHDNQMTAMFFAMGLYNLTEPLSNTTIETAEQAHGFSAAHATPFASRMYVEKLDCADYTGGEMVRVILNDRVMPLELCGSDDLGRCSLTNFVDTLTFAKQGGLWGKCSA